MEQTVMLPHTEAVKRERNLGIDALRIISMLMVVTLHVLGAEGLFLSYTSGVPNDILWLLESASYPAVNCYAVITGYVCITRKTHKYSRLMELVGQALFYSVIVQAVSELFHPDSGSLIRIRDSFIPSDIGGYWYFVAYCGLFFIIPLLNKIVLNSSKRTMWKIMIGSFIVFSCAPYIFQRDLFRTTGGFSMMWLAILYFFGAYLRLYGAPKLTAKRAFVGYLVCTALSFFAATSVSYFPKTIGDFELYKYLNGAFSYTAPLMVLAAVFLTVVFMGCNPKNRAVRRVISALAPFTFGVYLFHLHPEIWEWSKLHLHKLLNGVPQFAVVPVTVIVIISVYLLCTLGDFIRQQLFKLCRVPKMCSGLEKYLRGVFGKILNFMQ